MDTLLDWLGKADEISITYDMSVAPHSQLLLGTGYQSNTIPTAIHSENENINDIAEAVLMFFM